MYKDRDLVFFVSYYHCLQTVKKSFNKQNLKGHTTVLCFNRFKKFATMASLALGHEHSSEKVYRLITVIEWFPYFITHANLMTRQLLLETFMLPNSGFHQPNVWIERETGGHLHFSNIYKTKQNKNRVNVRQGLKTVTNIDIGKTFKYIYMCYVPLNRSLLTCLK